jgi:hypothetical protein
MVAISEEFTEKLDYFINLVESNEKFQSVKKEEDFDENDPFYKLLAEGYMPAIDLLISVVNSKEFHEQVNSEYNKQFNQSQY